MTVQASTPIELVKSTHAKLALGIKAGRELLQRPLTLAEKSSLGISKTQPAAISHGAPPTEISTLTESPCKMPPHRWLGCNS